MYVNQVSVESVNVSWTPPFTLNEVPILMYTVYITSQGYTETMNTTETNITLERPCASTTYEISAWNEVGEGNITKYGEILYICTQEIMIYTWSISYIISLIQLCPFIYSFDNVSGNCGSNQ